MKTPAMLLLVVSLAAAGCTTQTTADCPTKQQAKPYVPTKQRPIIMRRGKVVFGGKNGNRRQTVELGTPAVAHAVSAGGQRAAFVTASLGNATVLRIYDPDRKLLSETKLSEHPYRARVWVADDGFAVVGLGLRVEDALRRDRRLRPPQEEFVSKFSPPPFSVFVVPPEAKARGIKTPGQLSQLRMLGQRQWVALTVDRKQKKYALTSWKAGKKRWTRALPRPAKGAGRGYTLLTVRDTIQVLGPDWSRLHFRLDGKLLRTISPQVRGNKNGQ